MQLKWLLEMSARYLNEDLLNTLGKIKIDVGGVVGHVTLNDNIETSWFWQVLMIYNIGVMLQA